MKGVEASKALIESLIDNIDACVDRVHDIDDDLHYVNVELRKLLK